MKLRLAPILLSMVLTSAVLFGGWFAYRSVAMESPLSDTIHQIPGVKEAKMNIGSGVVEIRLSLEPDANLRKIMAQIREDGQAIIKNRDVRVTVDNEDTPKLDEWWSLLLFDVAEAMENRRYSDIPAALEHMRDELPGVAAMTNMDDDYVYIHLAYEDEHKFIVLPRIPAQMGVWPHE